MWDRKTIGQRRTSGSFAFRPIRSTGHVTVLRCSGETASLPQGVAQHDGVVVHFVVGRVDKCDGAFARQFSQVLERFGVAVDLLPIAAAEAIPFVGIMIEPLAKLRAGREVLQPLVDTSLGFGDPTWPQPIDEYSAAISAVGRLVSAFEVDISGFDSLAHNYTASQSRPRLLSSRCALSHSMRFSNSTSAFKPARSR